MSARDLVPPPVVHLDRPYTRKDWRLDVWAARQRMPINRLCKRLSVFYKSAELALLRAWAG